VQQYVSQPAIVHVVDVQPGRVALIYICVYVNATLEIPQNSRATCIVFVFFQDKTRQTRDVMLRSHRLLRHFAAACRNVPQRAATRRMPHCRRASTLCKCQHCVRNKQ